MLEPTTSEAIEVPRSKDASIPTEFQRELESLINQHSVENGSGTPDFILANYLKGCLDVFNSAVLRRDEWYGTKRL